MITKDTAEANVSFLQVQQQDNTIDCRVFAMAYCTEVCFMGKPGIAEIEFDRMRVRQHLYSCLKKYGNRAFSET